ncbi:MAG: cyclic nucleotide-binding domain-containing protein [Candidatus Hydrogenedentes bacterium]|nr:cyclic nucleotide-binding domain-containing protein [Candidatus Hydrogenedentota bacterium]
MSDLAKFEVLAKRVELFRGVEPENVAKIFSRGTTMRVPKGETIFIKGTTGNLMYIVLGGKVGIFDGHKILASLTSGDLFGEMALINAEPRSATALAMEDSFLFALNEQTFHKLMTKSVAIKILLNIVTTLSHRLKTANEKLAELEVAQEGS